MAIVRECTGHTCHSQHHVLWYDNRLIKYLHSILKKGMFLKVRGGKFNRPVQGWGSTCRFGARSEGSQRVRSINRIAPQGSHRYSRRGHDPIVLHPSHSTWEFYPNKILKNYSQNQKLIYELITPCRVHIKWLHPVEYTFNRRPPINPIKRLLSF